MRIESPHFYLSTACKHTLHDRCRKTCKYCEAPCDCWCHALAEDEDDD